MSTPVFAPRQGWRTALDLNFAALPTQALATDGAFTIGGYPFTKINSVNDQAAAQVVNGQGLVLQPKSTGDLYAVRTAPALLLALPDAIPGFTATTPFRVWAYVSAANFAANFDSAKFAVSSIANGVTNFCGYLGWGGVAGRRAPGSLFAWRGAQQSFGSAPNVEPLMSHDVIQIVMSEGLAGQKASVYSGKWVSGWPADNATSWLGYMQTTGAHILPANPVAALSDWSVLVCAQRSGSGTALSVTVARLRVDYMAGG